MFKSSVSKVTHGAGLGYRRKSTNFVWGKSKSDLCKKRTLQVDMFGQAYETRISDDEQELKSLKGSLFTILVLLLIAIFSYRKFNIFLTRKDAETSQHVRVNNLDEKEKFSYKDGFNIAVGLTSFDDNTEWELDPSYGELRFRASTWGQSEDGSIWWDMGHPEHHNCSKTELGLDSSASAS